jgi:hypothetical protein
VKVSHFALHFYLAFVESRAFGLDAAGALVIAHVGEDADEDSDPVVAPGSGDAVWEGGGGEGLVLLFQLGPRCLVLLFAAPGGLESAVLEGDRFVVWDGRCLVLRTVVDA